MSNPLYEAAYGNLPSPRTAAIAAARGSRRTSSQREEEPNQDYNPVGSRVTTRKTAYQRNDPQGLPTSRQSQSAIESASNPNVFPTAEPTQEKPEDMSLAGKAGMMALNSVAAVGNALDLPGSMARDVLTWLPGGTTPRNPFDQLLDPFGRNFQENRVEGRQMLRDWGLADKKEDTWANFGAGLALEVATDPLTYLGSFGLTKIGQVFANMGVKKLRPLAKEMAELSGKAGKNPSWVGGQFAKASVTGNKVFEHVNKFTKSRVATRVGQFVDGKQVKSESASSAFKSIDEAPTTVAKSNEWALVDNDGTFAVYKKAKETDQWKVDAEGTRAAMNTLQGSVLKMTPAGMENKIKGIYQHLYGKTLSEEQLAEALAKDMAKPMRSLVSVGLPLSRPAYEKTLANPDTRWDDWMKKQPDAPERPTPPQPPTPPASQAGDTPSTPIDPQGPNKPQGPTPAAITPDAPQGPSIPEAQTGQFAPQPNPLLNKSTVKPPKTIKVDDAVAKEALIKSGLSDTEVASIASSGPKALQGRLGAMGLIDAKGKLVQSNVGPEATRTLYEAVRLFKEPEAIVKNFAILEAISRTWSAIHGNIDPDEYFRTLKVQSVDLADESILAQYRMNFDIKERLVGAASQEANAGSFFHEIGHDIEKMFEGTPYLQDMTDAINQRLGPDAPMFKPGSGKWNTQASEAFADGFQEFANREQAEPGFWEHVKNLLSNIAKSITGKSKEENKLRRFFEDITKPQKAAADEATGGAGNPSKMDNWKREYQKSAEKYTKPQPENIPDPVSTNPDTIRTNPDTIRTNPDTIRTEATTQESAALDIIKPEDEQPAKFASRLKTQGVSSENSSVIADAVNRIESGVDDDIEYGGGSVWLEELDTDKLTATQSHRSGQPIKDSKYPILVLKDGDKYFIQDGHHRWDGAGKKINAVVYTPRTDGKTVFHSQPLIISQDMTQATTATTKQTATAATEAQTPLQSLRKAIKERYNNEANADEIADNYEAIVRALADAADQKPDDYLRAEFSSTSYEDFLKTQEEGDLLQESAAVASAGPGELTEAAKEWREKGVLSKYFKRWFGDWENDPTDASKVVDKDGKPLVVYHGTREVIQFNEFNNPYADDVAGNWHMFSESPEYSGEFTAGKGRIYPVYLDIKNPLDLTELPRTRGDVRNKLANVLKKLDFSDELIKSLPHERDLFQYINRQGFRNKLKNQAQLLGYDGIKMPDITWDWDGNEIKSTTWVAFDSPQIKSATANKGTFDATNPNILFQSEAEDFYYKTDRMLKEGKVGGKIGKDQFLATAKKYGVKDDEIEDLDIEGLFSDGKPKTKQEIQEWVDEHKVKIKDVTLGDDSSIAQELDRLYTEHQQKTNALESDLVNEILNTNHNPLSLKIVAKRAKSDGDLRVSISGEEDLSDIVTVPPGLNDNEIIRHIYTVHYSGYLIENLQQYSPGLPPGIVNRFRSQVANERKSLNSAVDKLKKSIKLDGHSRYSNYTIPGGIKGTYREKLITLDNKDTKDAWDKAHDDLYEKLTSQGLTEEDADWNFQFQNLSRELLSGQYHSPHFDQPNIVAHIRMDDVALPNGKKALRVQEIQSDWHQAGSKRGYKKKVDAELLKEKVTQAETRLQKATSEMTYWDNHIHAGSSKEHIALAEKADKAWEAAKRELESARQDYELALETGYTGDVALGPFKKSWTTLALKKILKEAAENGYEEVHIVKGSDAARAVGGPDTALGKFYDEILNADLKKLTKRWGSFQGIGNNAKQGRIWEKANLYSVDELDLRQDGYLKASVRKRGDKYEASINSGEYSLRAFKTLNEAKSWVESVVPEKFSGDVQVFSITPQMRKEILEQGQPLYQRTGTKGKELVRGAVRFNEPNAFAKVFLFENANISTVAHELGHVARRRLRKDLQDLAEKIYLVKDGKWTIEQEEAFARDFEKYLATGKAPTSDLTAIFAKMKQWISGIYKRIKNSPLSRDWSEEKQKLFDGMFTKKPEATTGNPLLDTAQGTPRRGQPGLFDGEDYATSSKPRNALEEAAASTEAPKKSVDGNVILDAANQRTANRNLISRHDITQRIKDSLAYTGKMDSEGIERAKLQIAIRWRNPPSINEISEHLGINKQDRKTLLDSLENDSRFEIKPSGLIQPNKEAVSQMLEVGNRIYKDIANQATPGKKIMLDEYSFVERVAARLNNASDTLEFNIEPTSTPDLFRIVAKAKKQTTGSGSSTSRNALEEAAAPVEPPALKPSPGQLELPLTPIDDRPADNILSRMAQRSQSSKRVITETPGTKSVDTRKPKKTQEPTTAIPKQMPVGPVELRKRKTAAEKATAEQVAEQAADPAKRTKRLKQILDPDEAEGIEIFEADQLPYLRDNMEQVRFDLANVSTPEQYQEFMTNLVKNINESIPDADIPEAIKLLQDLDQQFINKYIKVHGITETLSNKLGITGDKDFLGSLAGAVNEALQVTMKTKRPDKLAKKHAADKVSSIILNNLDTIRGAQKLEDVTELSDEAIDALKKADASITDTDIDIIKRYLKSPTETSKKAKAKISKAAAPVETVKEAAKEVKYQGGQAVRDMSLQDAKAVLEALDATPEQRGLEALKQQVQQLRDKGKSLKGDAAEDNTREIAELNERITQAQDLISQKSQAESELSSLQRKISLRKKKTGKNPTSAQKEELDSRSNGLNEYNKLIKKAIGPEPQKDNKKTLEELFLSMNKFRQVIAEENIDQATKDSLESLAQQARNEILKRMQISVRKAATSAAFNDASRASDFIDQPEVIKMIENHEFIDKNGQFRDIGHTLIKNRFLKNNKGPMVNVKILHTQDNLKYLSQKAHRDEYQELLNKIEKDPGYTVNKFATDRGNRQIETIMQIIRDAARKDFAKGIETPGVDMISVSAVDETLEHSISARNLAEYMLGDEFQGSLSTNEKLVLDTLLNQKMLDDPNSALLNRSNVVDYDIALALAHTESGLFDSPNRIGLEQFNAIWNKLIERATLGANGKMFIVNQTRSAAETQAAKISHKLARPIWNEIYEHVKGDSIITTVLQALDAGENLFYATPGAKMFLQLFDRSVMGAYDHDTQELARLRFQAFEQSVYQFREMLYPISRYIGETQLFDLKAIATNLIDNAKLPREEALTKAKAIINARNNEIIRFFEAKPEKLYHLSPEAFKDADVDLDKLENMLQSLKEAFPDMLEDQRKNGLSGSALFDTESMYYPRNYTEPGRHLRSRTQGEALMSTKMDSQRQRDEAYRHIPGGRALINEMSLDPKLSGIAHKEEILKNKLSKETLTAARKHAIAKYGLHNILSSDPIHGFYKDGKLTKKGKANVNRLITSIAKLPEDHITEGVPMFGHNFLRDFAAYAESHHTKNAVGLTVQDLVTRSATYKGEQKYLVSSLFQATALDNHNAYLNVLRGTDNFPGYKQFVDEKIKKLIKDKKLSVNRDANGKITGYTYKHTKKPQDFKTLDEFIEAKHLSKIYADKIKLSVPKEIHESATHFLRTWTTPPQISTLVQISGAALNTFKSLVTLPFPSFHSRNFISGMMQNVFYGAYDPTATIGGIYSPVLGHIKPLRQAVSISNGNVAKGISKEIPRFLWDDDLNIPDEMIGTPEGDELVTDWVRQGVFRFGLTGDKQGQAAEKIGDTVSSLVSQNPGAIKRNKDNWYGLKPAIFDKTTSAKGKANPIGIQGSLTPSFQKAPGEGRRKLGLQRTEDTTFVAGRIGEEMSLFVENANRIMPYIAFLKQGVTPEEAAKRVNMIQFDYSNLSDFERRYMKQLIPFYTFTSKALKLTLGDLITNPAGKQAWVIRGTNRLQDREAAIPEHIRKGVAIPLPQGHGGEDRYLSGFGLAWEDPIELMSFMHGDVQGTASSLFSKLRPEAQGFAELAFGRSAFFGRDFRDMDPQLGRLRDNLIGQSGKGLSEPIAGSQSLEVLAGKLPTSRLVSSVNQAFDDRKSAVDKLLNLATGFKVNTVNEEAKNRIIMNRVNEEMKDLGAREMGITYVPEWQKQRMSEAERRRMELLQQMVNEIKKESRENKKKAQLENLKAAASTPSE